MLTADLIRLRRMAYFVEKFKTLAYDFGMDIAGANRHLVFPSLG